MKNPKYKIGDRILLRGEVKSIVQIQINIHPTCTSIYYYYEAGFCIHEDHIVLAPKFNKGDTVYFARLNNIYKDTVKSSDKALYQLGKDYYVYEMDLHSTEAEARAAIKLVDLTVWNSKLAIRFSLKGKSTWWHMSRWILPVTMFITA